MAQGGTPRLSQQARWDNDKSVLSSFEELELHFRALILTAADST